MSKKQKFEYEEQGTNSIIEGLTKQSKEEAAKYELEKKREKFEKSLVDLENTMVEFAVEYGRNDFRTELLVNLYDVCIEMQTAIKMMSGVMVALDCINQTMSFMDECLSFNELVEQQSLEHKYGLFYKIKAFFRRRRVNRNMKNRINALTQRINDIFGLSNTMVESLRKSMTKMKVQMEKQKANREKKLSKNGLEQPSFEKTRAADILDKRLSQEGTVEETNNDNGSTDNNAGGNEAPSSSSGSANDSPNIDGIA